MSGVAEARIVAAVLEQALSTEGTRQIFVFGPEGAPFWAAKMPVMQDDLSQLGRALALIESMEDSRARRIVTQRTLKLASTACCCTSLLTQRPSAPRRSAAQQCLSYVQILFFLFPLGRRPITLPG